MRGGASHLKPAPPAFGRIGARSGKKYWLLVVVIAIPLFYAQCVWMQGAKRRAPDSPWAESIQRFMMKAKGVSAEEAASVAASSGVPRPMGGPREDIAECVECGGSGFDGSGEACPVCFGHGKRLLRRAPGEELCTACVGMGRVRGGDDGTEVMDCPRCGGRGLVAPAAEAAAETEEQK